MRRPKPGRQPAREPHTNVFLECVAAPPAHPHWAGLRKGVYVTPPAQQGGPDHVRTVAETMRRRLQHLYGGQWITLVESPQSSEWA